MRSMNQVKEKEKLHSQTTIIIPKGKVDKFSAQNTTQAVQVMAMILFNFIVTIGFPIIPHEPKNTDGFPKALKLFHQLTWNI